MDPRSPAAAGKSSVPLLTLDRATVLRGGKPVLHDLTFEIAEGEHTVILGPNGCGKSSLIRMVDRQDYPLPCGGTGGPIQIFGKERWDVFELRSHLGIVSADLHQAFLMATGGGRRRGREVVLSGAFASQGLFSHQHVTSAMVEQAERALDLVGARHLADKRIEAMSTGEARRILIARALAPDPRALLLDEPTTGLDLVARHHFLKMLQAIVRHGKTLLLVTHHIEEILPQIQRVVLLKEGRVFLDGPKHEILTTKNLTSLYGAEIVLQQSGDYFSAQCEEG
jgi:iron complex transport system ATP-binding protein